MLRNKVYKNDILHIKDELEILKYNVKNLTKQAIRDDIQRIIDSLTNRAKQVIKL